MIFEEMLRDERAEGKAEGLTESKIEDIFGFLEELGEIPENLRSRISDEKDLELLKKWLKLAAKSDTMEEFLKRM